MNDLEILIPIVAILVLGGLVALRILKPFGNRLLDLLERIHRDRQETRLDDSELDRLRERMDLLAERQEFLEAILTGRKEPGAVAEGDAGSGRPAPRGLESVGRGRGE